MNLALSKKDYYIGHGSSGEVYKIPGGFNGVHEAVVKEIWGIDDSKKSQVEAEVKNLVTVHQFLAWGFTAKSKEGIQKFYIIMPAMGVSAKDTGKDDKTLLPLREAAVAEYRQKYHIENR